MEPATVESRLKRLKPIWRFLLISNLALGAYMFAKAGQKSKSKEKNISRKKRAEDAKARERASAVIAMAGDPIPEDQQRELLQWMLEEKMKVEPKDRHEKKQIDQEKALIEQFIRALSIPKL